MCSAVRSSPDSASARDSIPSGRRRRSGWLPASASSVRHGCRCFIVMVECPRRSCPTWGLRRLDLVVANGVGGSPDGEPAGVGAEVAPGERECFPAAHPRVGKGVPERMELVLDRVAVPREERGELPAGPDANLLVHRVRAQALPICAAAPLQLAVVRREPDGGDLVQRDGTELRGHLVADDLPVAVDRARLQPQPAHPQLGLLGDRRHVRNELGVLRSMLPHPRRRSPDHHRLDRGRQSPASSSAAASSSRARRSCACSTRRRCEARRPVEQHLRGVGLSPIESEARSCARRSSSASPSPRTWPRR